jgi:hypothetical protein
MATLLEHISDRWGRALPHEKLMQVLEGLGGHMDLSEELTVEQMSASKEVTDLALSLFVACYNDTDFSLLWQFVAEELERVRHDPRLR